MGIFDDKTDLFTVYEAELQFRDKVMGGTPKDPAIIEGWLRSRAGITDEEQLKEATARTISELHGDEIAGLSVAQAAAAVDITTQEKHLNAFKRDTNGLYIESRQVKALLKECTNVLFAGERWGRTKKGPRSYLSERVFVGPDQIYLGCEKPDGVELFVGHTTGPNGPQSNLTRYEYCEKATITFRVKVVEDSIENQNWPKLWVLAQEEGIGAIRSQGHGCFDILRWDKVEAGTKQATAE